MGLHSILDGGLSRQVLAATEGADWLDRCDARSSISIAWLNIRSGSQTKASGEGDLLKRGPSRGYSSIYK